MALIDPKLYEYATPRQREYMEAIEAHGSGRAAGAALGVHPAAVNRGYALVKSNAARAGYAPGHFKDGVAPGYAMGKVTVQRGADGNVERTWERQSPELKSLETFMRVLEERFSESAVLPAPLISPPSGTNADLLAVYPIGDPHFGAYAYAEETGDDYDLKIADAVHRKAIDWLVGIAPPAREALLVNLGDMLHANDSKNMTPGHGNILDVDTRYEKVMVVAVDMMIHATYRLLEKHEKVTVWNVRGNHDPEAHFAIALAMRHHFRDNPRVSINTKPADYLYYRFDKNLIGSHHGHGAKGADLPLLMATDRAQDWGETEHRVWLCGHVHHRSLREMSGCEVETFSTLAGKDAWHAQKGYRSKRGASMIVYHATDGEAVRYRVPAKVLA